MWYRFADSLRCPTCFDKFELPVIASRNVPISDEHRKLAASHAAAEDTFSTYVDTGLLLCHRCKIWYPVFEGLPILLPYPSPLREEFLQRHSGELKNTLDHFASPAVEPPPGERLVMQSFSTEWRDYDFDGVIWELDYADSEQRFLSELGVSPRTPEGNFLELGCGLGITTAIAQKDLACDAVGVDLSIAALRATKQHELNPFLHFVQASVFYLPFAPQSFDLIYTRGVLHHTYSTQEAFFSLAKLSRPGGLMYVWVYGSGSVNDNVVRRLAYTAEVALRWVLNRSPQWVESLVLVPMAAAYVLANALQRLRRPELQSYNFKRALHAARDRFTPEFAHRQDADEVSRWFQNGYFEKIETVDWKNMPIAAQDDFRRNTGVRAVRGVSN